MTDIAPNKPLPALTLPRLGGGEITLGKPETGDWQMIVVYRGLHCPICKSYLKELEPLLSRYREAGVEVVAISGDPEDKAKSFVEETGVTLPVGYGLSIEDMRRLGLYVSDPRSPQETDQPFSEPGLFVVNHEGKLQIVDISNAPFARPDLEQLVGGIEFVREKDYPVRGQRFAA